MTDFFDKLYRSYRYLSDTEQDVIDFIIQYKDIENLKLKNIEKCLFISSSTVLRACKKIGYDSFTKLKYDLLNHKEQNTIKEQASNFTEIIDKVTNDFLKTISLLTEENVRNFSRFILQARRIFCIGIGSSSSVISEFNRKLKLIDIWSNDYSEKYSIERIPEISSDRDLIVAFSLSGETKDINETVLQAKKNGTKIISLTNISNNTLNTLSDFNLYVYASPSNRKKVRSRLMLNIAADIIYENLTLTRKE